MKFRRLTACLLTVIFLLPAFPVKADTDPSPETPEAGTVTALAEEGTPAPEEPGLPENSFPNISLPEHFPSREETPAQAPDALPGESGETEEPPEETQEETPSEEPQDPAETPEDTEDPSEGGEEEEPDPERPELPDHLCESVEELLKTEDHTAYLSGYPNGRFYPNNQISRAEAAQLFYNLLRETPEITTGFADVPENAWYAPAVNALASLGALRGDLEGTFRPEASITRAEFVTIAARFSSLLEGELPFSDLPEGYWANKYVASAVAHKWLQGYPDGTFRPYRRISRAEAVVVINAMLGRVPDKDLKEMYLSKRFTDVKRDFWAFPQICEASVSHEYSVEKGSETWLPSDAYCIAGWTAAGAGWKYRDYETGEFVKGFRFIEDRTYYFEPETRKLITGWRTVNGSRYLLPTREQTIRALPVKNILTKVNYNEADRGFGDVRYITVHYTAEPGDTAAGECQAFLDTYRAASAHYFVDQNGICRCVLDKDISWHCGSSHYYHDDCRNTTSIGIEMCCRKSSGLYGDTAYHNDWYFLPETETNTAALVRELMMQYGIPLENVVRHNDVSHKVCPAPYVLNFSAWQRFLQLVTRKETSYQGAYPARAMSNLTVYAAPGFGYSTVKQLKKNDRFTVYEERGSDITPGGRWFRIDNGWVSDSYVSRISGMR